MLKMRTIRDSPHSLTKKYLKSSTEGFVGILVVHLSCWIFSFSRQLTADVPQDSTRCMISFMVVTGAQNDLPYLQLYIHTYGSMEHEYEFFCLWNRSGVYLRHHVQNEVDNWDAVSFYRYRGIQCATKKLHWILTIGIWIYVEQSHLQYWHNEIMRKWSYIREGTKIVHIYEH